MNENGERPYVVRSRVITVVTDIVYARSGAEAIRRVENGQGDRISAVVDESCPPTRITAEVEPVDFTLEPRTAMEALVSQ